MSPEPNPDRPGILLINLGSPDSPSVPDVRKYLGEFLMDGRVIDAPLPIRFLIVHGFILPTRPKESAKAYATIWTEAGSPLVAMARRVRDLLQQRMAWPVEVCMRYQNPTPREALLALQRRGATRVALVPLFPHYAMSSYESAVEKVRADLLGIAPAMPLSVTPPFYGHPSYLQALAETARPFVRDEFDHLLVTFHGLPERHLRKSDPTHAHCLASPGCCEGSHPAHATCYRHQCLVTAAGIAERLGIPASKYSVSFQSRLGRDPWLKPFTDHEVVRLPKAGKKRLVVMSPAFVADCLETIEEIGDRARHDFLANGGTDFRLVPCLNDHPAWIDTLETLVRGTVSDRLPA
ncbi:MAG: ferrochelatase [Verrucomicrobia bacterium]|nr:MAG: ferrochelatase [Verrucomicrobiota bacterium]